MAAPALVVFGLDCGAVLAGATVKKIASKRPINKEPLIIYLRIEPRKLLYLEAATF
jgi:hypothetical protein